MTDTDLLKQATFLISKKDYANALLSCETYLTSFPEDSSGLRLKAKILAMTARYAEAIDVITSILVGKENKKEPCDYFYRGRWSLLEGDIFNAVADFSEVILIGEDNDFSYYTEDARLHRAYCYLRLNYTELLISELNNIDNEIQTSIFNTVISRKYLLNLIGG